MAKLCCAIQPLCGAKEPPPADASSCMDTDFTPDIKRLQQLVVLLRDKVVQLRHKSCLGGPTNTTYYMWMYKYLMFFAKFVAFVLPQKKGLTNKLSFTIINSLAAFMNIWCQTNIA